MGIRRGDPVRNHALFCLEKHFPKEAAKLRKEYDTPYWRNKWGLRFQFLRTKKIQEELSEIHPIVFKRYLEEIAKSYEART